MKKIPRKTHTCSNCGARDPLIMRGKALAILMSKADREGIDRETARHQTYAGFRKYQEHKGYKPGYVGVKFREMYGVWPNGETGTPAAPMTQELGLWLRRSTGRFVARKRKERRENCSVASMGRDERIALINRLGNLTKRKR